MSPEPAPETDNEPEPEPETVPEPETDPPRAMMAFVDGQGRIFDHPELELIGWDGECWRPLEDDEIVPVPRGSDFFTLPGRLPAGFDRAADEVVVVDQPGVAAVSCFGAPAYLRTLLPAYETVLGAPALPLFAYGALGVRDGELVTACLRVDEDIRQDPYRFDLDAITAGVERRVAAERGNRLVAHLGRCALVYHCRAAQNYFLDRFEAPLPVAPSCNARCLGCLSLQAPGDEASVTACHDRIAFVPTPEELAAVAVGHIERVGDDAVVSFGQGCEGEPLLQADTLEAAVRLIRAATRRGVVNLNTNASRPAAIERLASAGLDSLRVSTNSARAEVYGCYYRPRGYGFGEVRRSARAMRAAGGYLMLNYLVFPGVTDTPGELEALSAWIDEAGVDMLQLRNLNIDPEIYLRAVHQVVRAEEPMGIAPWLREVRRRHPRLRWGYFNPPRRLFAAPPAPVAGL